MTDLFEHAEKYPNAPGFAKGSETSREAAARLTDRDFIHAKIIDALAFHPGGLIVDEAKSYLESIMGRDFDRSTIAARFTELENDGRIMKTSEKRQTPRGRNAFVYKKVT